MGSLAKKMLKQRARQAKKKALADLREVGKTPLFLLVGPSGAPLLESSVRKGETVVQTWCFTTYQQAQIFLVTRNDEGNPLEIGTTINRLPAEQFLGSLLNHLAQADIDFLVLDGETEFPLTTIGVRLLDDENWTELLNHTRSVQANLLLTRVCMDVLQAAHPPSAVVVETATYADLVRMLMGKKGHFPSPDLGIVWMLASSVAKGVEPLFIKLPQDEPNKELTVGPMFFTDYGHALRWPTVVPPQVAVHMADMALNLVPYRAMGLLEEVNDNFPTTSAEYKPDMFLVDGGALPMTTAGAVFTDLLAYGETPPAESFITIANRGETELHKATVLLLAAHLGIRIVHPDPAPEEG